MNKQPIKKRLVKSKTLSMQVYDILCQSILKMKPNQNKLPSEEELARQLGVSRATIREALKLLSIKRAISSIHGRGTFAHPSVLKLKNRIDQDNDFGQMIKQHYGNVQIDVAWNEEESADSLYDKWFPDMLSVKIFLNYSADQQKRLFTRYHFPRDFFTQPLPEQLKIASLPHLSHLYMAEDIDYCAMECRVKIDSEACEQLDLPQGTPLMCWDEVIYDVGDRSVGTGEVFVHPENMVMTMVARLEY